MNYDCFVKKLLQLYTLNNVIIVHACNKLINDLLSYLLLPVPYTLSYHLGIVKINPSTPPHPHV